MSTKQRTSEDGQRYFRKLHPCVMTLSGPSIMCLYNSLSNFGLNLLCLFYHISHNLFHYPFTQSHQGGFALFSPVSFTFGLSCEYHIFRAHIPYFLCQKFQLCLLDLEYMCPFYCLCFESFVVDHIFDPFYSRQPCLASHICYFKSLLLP